MTVVVLHLSDLHAKFTNDPVLDRGSLIARSIFPLLSNAEAVLIVFSGDIAFSGRANEYSLVTPFLEEIRTTIAGEKEIPIHLFFAPGNHDCDLSGEQDVRNVLIEDVAKRDINDVSDEIIENCIRVQENFFEFRDAISEVPASRQAYGMSTE